MKYLSIILLVLFCGCKENTEIDTPAKWYRIPPTKMLLGKDTLIMSGFSLYPVDSFSCVSSIHDCNNCYFSLLRDTVYTTGDGGGAAKVGYFPFHISHAFSFGDSVRINIKYIRDTVYVHDTTIYSHNPWIGTTDTFPVPKD